MKINILTEEVIGKISAGEVVERPASVVKELIENSIDAGADSIDIAVEGAGTKLIRVADNGTGMSTDDAKLSCLRHTTSKISSAEDIYRINTLGFRGEALASIAAVSKMEITTFDGEDKSGTCMYVESGEILRIRPAGRPRGTTIEVENLFYNVPARRKFLRKESSELTEIVSVVGRFIVSNPDIEISLTQEGRRLFHSNRGESGIERVAAVLGDDVAGSMMEIDSGEEKYRVKGFISSPSSTRKDRRAQMFFLNGRYVKSRMISETIQYAYRGMLERGRYPAAVLFITVSPEDVDVNVHPSKLMVKFSDEKALKEVLQRTVYGRFKEEKKKDISAFREKEDGRTGPEEFLLREEDKDIQTEFAYKENLSGPAGKRSFCSEGLPFGEIQDTERPFQVGGCYIVQVNDEDVLITDQHAAHERVLYEVFSKAKESGPPEMQDLLFPIRMDLSAEEALIMNKMIEDFKTIGFLLEAFGDNSFIVRAVPAIIKDRDVKTVVADVLADMSAVNLSRVELVDELVKIAACRGAIKAGDRLGEDEMLSVLSQLSRCDLPFTCPHGRPTSFRITIDEMEKRFRRK
ncbi:MAG: DNA mismatch repair endonuclease MutL [Candidatus Omnitrophota bacterium]|nr:DNA mismatch repair endonuclease MutL [Candidatus Omnitrophota bacterium]